MITRHNHIIKYILAICSYHTTVSKGVEILERVKTEAGCVTYSTNSFSSKPCSYSLGRVFDD
jgi:hypothetical protein